MSPVSILEFVDSLFCSDRFYPGTRDFSSRYFSSQKNIIIIRNKAKKNGFSFEWIQFDLS